MITLKLTEQEYEDLRWLVGEALQRDGRVMNKLKFNSWYDGLRLSLARLARRMGVEVTEE
jgi:hypothetical protein